MESYNFAILPYFIKDFSKLSISLILLLKTLPTFNNKKFVKYIDNNIVNIEAINNENVAKLKKPNFAKSNLSRSDLFLSKA